MLDKAITIYFARGLAKQKQKFILFFAALKVHQSFCDLSQIYSPTNIFLAAKDPAKMENNTAKKNVAP